MSSNGTTNYTNITNEELLLVNILNTMYNDNILQIQTLQESNNQIRSLLTSVLYSRGQNRSSRSRSNRNITNNNLAQRVFINNTPYVISDVQEYYIPNNNLNSNENILQSQNVNTNTNTIPFNLSQFIQTFFDPVEIFPTETQIEIATRNARYRDILSPRNRSCPISLENFNDHDTVTIIRYCGHIFNTNELNTWFRSNCRCPVCRYDIRNFNPNNTSNENTVPNEQTTVENSSSINNTQNIDTTQNIDDSLPQQPTRLNNIVNQLLTSNLFNTEQQVIDYLLDPSGNFISDANTVLNLFNSIQRRQ